MNAPAVTPADIAHLEKCLKEVQENPMRGDEILAANRAFLSGMVKITRDAGMQMPARFNAIVRRLGL